MKHRITFALIMGICTTGIISFTLVAVNVGFNEQFLKTWLHSWSIAYMVVIPVILVIGPRIQKLVDRMYKQQ